MRPEPLPMLRDMRLVLAEQYGEPFDSIGFNLYRDGHDSVAWHSDRHAPNLSRMRKIAGWDGDRCSGRCDLPSSGVGPRLGDAGSVGLGRQGRRGPEAGWSGGSGVEGGDADQVVDGGGDLEPGSVAFSADVAELASSADRS